MGALLPILFLKSDNLFAKPLWNIFELENTYLTPLCMKKMQIKNTLKKKEIIST
jgi:hypothetical protein